MKVVKLNCKDFMTNGLEFVVQSETETHYIGAPNYHIPKVACTIIDTWEKPEQKGYCIKRTPENAEVLNEWANNKEFPDGYVFYTNKDGYAYSEKICGNYCVGELHEGFTELFTVEEFFAKVGYTPEPKEMGSSSFAPSLTSTSRLSSKEILDNSNEPKRPQKKDFEVAFGTTERIDKPIDKVTIERLDMVLRMCNIQLSHSLIDKIIDAVELIEEKGEETSLMDVCKMQAQWKQSKLNVQ